MAFSREPSAAQDAEWDALDEYSFVQALPGRKGWFSIRGQMRWALENQPSAQERVKDDHHWWQQHWAPRAGSPVDDAASLAWYHSYCLKPVAALDQWNGLAEAARTSAPPRMQEHFTLLRWWEPVGLLESPPASRDAAGALNSLGVELGSASLGNRTGNLRQAIACYEAALRVRTEQDFPLEHKRTLANLQLARDDFDQLGGDATPARQTSAGAQECGFGALGTSAGRSSFGMVLSKHGIRTRHRGAGYGDSGNHAGRRGKNGDSQPRRR